ncbi:pimeloyl-ACP methyl ester carboxylesterase [Streptosporangium becharense]|uniref:Pimeloyl-ACP methyl ester carboxylesterase n=1 Tax=Streptosporangium becharense TaxID=1816182 RepID=A0A7W9IAL7_9ACTN|nr:alpha/beta fold hydrolase [Streptosporangium becharense]MBB2915292.1 pimeloyl-ACP methyl ester carboxylesterase [Streptosporangium becharense]MBB5817010.1 pimeloyl-ACP methyl ester carboxylesterase [Streptosporangium becharense]
MPGLQRPTRIAELAAGPVEYRLDGTGNGAQSTGKGTVLVFHGGHMRAGLPLGEEVFIQAGYRVLVPSRPGYGRTPPRTGKGSAAAFTDVTADLCDHLGIEHLAAVVGISAGGRTAVTMAARHPHRVHRLILQSAVAFLPWPDRRTRIAAGIAFIPATQALTWGAVRLLMRLAPSAGLRLMLSDLSTHPAADVVCALSEKDRVTLVELFTLMRSGHGFTADLRAVPDLTAQVTQPTLIIASRHDASVPLAHAESLTAAIPGARLAVSEADSHFVWFSPDYPAIAAQIRDFLTTGD